jgi:hypothetical protein
MNFHSNLELHQTNFNNDSDHKVEKDTEPFTDQATSKVSGTYYTRESRVRHLTEKGLAYHIEVTAKQLKTALHNHKRSCEHYEKVLDSKDYNAAKLLEARGSLESLVDQFSELFHKLGSLSSDKQNEFQLTFHERIGINRDLLVKITHALRVIENLNRNTASGHRSSSHKSESKSGSSHSRSKTHSGSSSTSRSRRSKASGSSVTSMKLEAAAKAAALKAKLQYHDVEVEHKAQLDGHKAQLAKLSLLRDIAVEEAKLRIISEFPDPGGTPTASAGDNALPTVSDGSVHAPLSSCSAFMPASTGAANVVLSSMSSSGVPVPVHGLDPPPKVAANMPIASKPAYYPTQTPGIVSSVPTAVTAVNVSSRGNGARGVGLNSGIDMGSNHVVTSSTNTGGYVPSFNTGVQSGIYTSADIVNSVNSTLPNFNVNAPVFVPSVNAQVSPVNTYVSSAPPTASLPSPPHLDMHSLIDGLSRMCNMSKLPVPEPGIFHGDPLEYPSWRTAFSTLIESRNIAPAERIHYLKRYLGGKAKECVEGYLMIPTEDSYAEAVKLIEKRYGSQFVIAQAFKSRIASWSKISGRDAPGLRKFCDFLRQCEVAARTNSSLRVLDDDSQNHMILSKLPDWLVSRWSRIVYQVTESQNRYPSFQEFVGFLSKEADIACNPVTMLQSVNSGKSSSVGFKSDSYLQRGLEKVGKTLNTTHTDLKCNFCDKPGHAMDKCQKFMGKSMDERKAFILDKRLCFGCFTAGHVSKQCRNRLKCATCSKSHPTTLHGDVRPKDGKSDKTDGARDSKPSMKVEDDKPSKCDKPDKSTSKGHISLFCSQQVACKSTMIIPVYVSHENNTQNEVLVYALLDTQSDTSFISDATYAKLGVSGIDTVIKLATMTEEGGVLKSHRLNGLFVRGVNSDVRIAVPTVYTHGDIPCCRDTIPTPETAMRWPHLHCIANELMPKSDCDIGLLLGYNCPRALAPRDVIPPEGDGPFAQKTDLGWRIVGSVQNSTVVDQHNVHVCGQVTGIHVALRTSAKELILPTSESDDVFNPFQKGLSREDQRFLALMEAETRQNDDGHYEMPLPFRDPGKVLVNNKVMADDRLKSLIKRFRRDPVYHQHYVTFMNDLLQNDYAELVPEDELGDDTPAYYLPHHGVYNPSKPGKVRVVMDGSAKFMGESLNSNLLTGPDLLNGLVGVLCRFRQGYIAVTCDIKGMFQQFRVSQKHRNFLRFLWFQDGDFNNEPIILRSKVHLFGAVCSPAIANYGLRRAAQDGSEKYGPCVVDFIHNNFYVDDGLKSLDSEKEAIVMIDSSKKLCQDSGLTLHKFTSNSLAVLQSLSPSERSDSTKDLDLRHDALPVERALGIKWCMESDHFKFRVIVDSKPLTRRGVLSTVSSIFDPLGLIAPVILEGKMILQEMCRSNLDWDDALPESLLSRWQKWLHCLPNLELLSIPRCYKPADFGCVMRAELHHFSDASNLGYGACSYLRLIDENNKVHCSLVMSKSRVAPLKVTTIPRLELTAAVLATEVSQLLDKELQYELHHSFWTDSRIVLGFINSEARRFHVYVSNRVQTIRDVSEPDQWHYVHTEDNPADIASRGATGEQLAESQWFTGPEFLWQPNFKPNMEVATVDETNPEVRKVVCLDSTVTEVEYSFPLKFSSWNRTKRVLALCLRFVDRLRKRSHEYSALKVSELVNAENFLIRQAQRAGFSEELRALQSQQSVSKHSKLKDLDVFLDGAGLIRVGGRLKHGAVTYEIQHPVVLPKEDPVSDLIVLHCHEVSAHQGRGLTTNEVRNQGFWILGLSAKVSSLIHKCIKCRKLRATSQQQKMGELPSDRLEAGPVFSYVAVDYFGPFHIREGRRDVKRYGVLFTCLNSRAIHLEVTKSLDTDAFINAWRRFLSIRGPVRVLRSDRGTNLMGGYRELREAISMIDDEAVQAFLVENSCDYVVNVPHASHQGGVWERQIRSLRGVLNSLIGSGGHLLDDDSFRTFMSEAANIVNSRPLTVTSLNDPTSLQPLTPNHLLFMKSNVVLPPPGVFQDADSYSRKRWKRVQYFLDSFWNRWKKEVLALWQIRQKWQKPYPNLQVGDIVLVVDEQLPRCQWRLGRIVQVYPSHDSLVRKVKLILGDPGLSKRGIRTKNPTYLERPIQKLILLWENSNETD